MYKNCALLRVIFVTASVCIVRLLKDHFYFDIFIIYLFIYIYVYTLCNNILYYIKFNFFKIIIFFLNFKKDVNVKL